MSDQGERGRVSAPGGLTRGAHATPLAIVREIAFMRSIMRNGCLALALIVSLVGWAGAQPSWDKALKSSGVAGTFDPATAKRGQVVTLRMEVELDPGYHTYSLIQTSPD